MISRRWCLKDGKEELPGWSCRQGFPEEEASEGSVRQTGRWAPGCTVGAYQRPAPDLGFYVVAEKTEGCEQLVEMVPATVLCARHGARLFTDTH